MPDLNGDGSAAVPADTLTNLLATMTTMVENQQKLIQHITSQQPQPQQTSVPSQVTPLLSFENFHSTKESFKQYRERFENYLKMKNVFTDKKLCHQMLINSIGPEGYKVLCMVSAPQEPNQVSYDQLMNSVEVYLCPRINSVVEQHKFFSCNQTQDQSVAQYIAVLKQRIADCEFKCDCKCACTDCNQSIVKMLLRAQFVRGLYDSHTREQLLKVKDLDFDKAVAEALALEASKVDSREITRESQASSDVKKVSHSSNSNVSQSSRPKHNSKPKNNRSQSQHSNDSGGSSRYRNRSRRRIDYRELGIDNLCLRCGKDNHRFRECQAGRGDFTCSLCKRTGHVDKVCIKTLLRQSKPRSKSNVRQVESSHVSDISNLDLYYDISVPSLNLVTEINDASCNVVTDVFSQSHSMHQDLGKFYAEVLIDGKPQRFEVDSGAGYTFLPKKDFDRLNLPQPIQPVEMKFRVYTNQIFQPLGIVEVPVCYNGKTLTESMFIVDSELSPLLGRSWIRHFNINLTDLDQSDGPYSCFIINNADLVPSIIKKYCKIFEQKVGHVPDVLINLKLRDGSKPVYIRERDVPYALRELVEFELDALERDGIITRVNLSDWGSPLVVIPKPDGGVRLCVDYKVGVNPQLQEAHYPIRKIDEILNDLRGATYFCRLDLYKAYLHFEVDDESKAIQAISTHRGTYLVNRLSLGIRIAPSEFNRIFDQKLRGLEGVIKYFDDLVVYGRTLEECYARLIKLLDRLAENDMHLNIAKCSFFLTVILFLGFIISYNKIQKCPKKVTAITEAPRPVDADDVRRFLGMVTYYSRFISNLSTITYPLRTLLVKDHKFRWTPACEAAFLELKAEIASDRVLMPYDPDLPVTVVSDASPTGVGAVLSYKTKDGERPVAFASRSLSQAERHYSQLDREAVGIIFAINKFFVYLFGRHFFLATDCRALSRIFHQDEKLPAMTAARLLRYATFLSSFNYTLKHRKAEDIQHVDYLSRLHSNTPAPESTGDSLDQEVCDLQDQVINQISTLQVTAESIASETDNDPELSVIKQHLLDGTLADPDFSLKQGIIFKANRVFIPASLRASVLQELHHTHVGIVKMKQLARRYCYWKSIDRDIEHLVKSCEPCALVQKSPAKVPVHVWDEPPENFYRVHIDYAGEYLNHHFLILVDAKSKWVEVKISKRSPTSEITITLLSDIFSQHGFPKIMTSDNAMYFKSELLDAFCRKNGIYQKFSSPNFPATNGLAERTVQTIKYKLARMSTDSTLPLCEKVQEIVFRYRATPLASGKSPAELYLGRPLRIKLDAMFPHQEVARQEPQHLLPPSRQLREGDRVQARWYQNNKPTWKFGQVVEKLGALHYLIKLDSGHVFKRHIDQLRKSEVPQSDPPAQEPAKKKVTFHDSTSVPLDLTPPPEQPQPGNQLEQPLIQPQQPQPVIQPQQPLVPPQQPQPLVAQRRSGRDRRPPRHLQDYSVK